MWERTDYPDCLPQFNTGVIAYNKSPKIESFFMKWKQCRKNRPEGHDQPTFREAILQTGVNIGVLSQRYNFRAPFPDTIDKQYLPVVLHDRQMLGKTENRIIELINSIKSQKRRWVVWRPDVYK
mgnify:FL=1